MIDRDNKINVRLIKEALWSRKTTPIINRDEGDTDSATRGTGEQKKTSLSIIQYLWKATDGCRDVELNTFV